MVFSMPKAPTDSLYKFLAIFGLTISLSAFVYSDHVENEARKKVIEFAEYPAKINYEAANDSIIFAKADEDEKKRIKNKHEFYKNKFDTLGTSMIVQSKKFDLSKKIKYVGGILGIMMSFFGFLFWYRCQRHLDKVLENQAKELNKPEGATLRN